MSLKVFQTKAAQHEPEFESAEASAEGDLPVLNHGQSRCHCLLRDSVGFMFCLGFFFCFKSYISYHEISDLFVVMSEVHRINSKRLMKLGFILHPVKTNETILSIKSKLPVYLRVNTERQTNIHTDIHPHGQI